MEKFADELTPLRPNESFKLVVEKHWVTNLMIAAIFLGFGIFTLGLSAVFGFWLVTKVSMLGFIFYLLLNFLYAIGLAILGFVHYRNEEGDRIVVTTERLITCEQIDFLHRRVAETGLAQIQDVKASEKGVLQNLFHFGTLEITTASSDIFFKIKDVAAPYEAARAILQARDESLRRSPQNSQDSL